MDYHFLWGFADDAIEYAYDHSLGEAIQHYIY